MNIGVYTLFKGRISGVSISNKNGRGNEGHLDLAFVRCYCFSTDRMFFLGCDPAHNNAKDAIASLYRIPRKMKPHLKYINRQGERFSSTFTEEGKVLRNALSKEDFSDLVEISGDEYFSLMRYEY